MKDVPLAKRAALISTIAPISAMLIGLITRPLVQESKIGALVLGLITASLIVAGFASAIIGLRGVKQHGRDKILVRSWVGLILNGILICMTIWSSFALSRINQKREELLSKPLFTFKAPDGYMEFPEGKISPDILHCFLKGNSTDDQPDIALNLMDLQGLITKGQKLSTDLSALKSTIPSLKSATTLQHLWKYHEVEGLRIEQDVGDYSVISMSLQIPLFPRAIQINISGIATREEELLEDLKKVVSSIDGTSNW
ncbi:MAG: hypothetical protein EDM74_12650 [Armatimonadetes bacterium]|nr:MAG: hypothetical protein EDM74_12650 [Armatimonadota bacterium]